MVVVIVVVGCCLRCHLSLTCPLYLHWLVVAFHFVPPPHYPILTASQSAAASQQTAMFTSHSPLVCLGYIASSHATASCHANTSWLSRLVVALPMTVPPLSLLVCHHFSMRHCLPFVYLFAAWCLLPLQPLDAPLAFNTPSGCCVASFAPAGCSITSHCTTSTSQRARPCLSMHRCSSLRQCHDLLFASC